MVVAGSSKILVNSHQNRVHNFPRVCSRHGNCCWEHHWSELILKICLFRSIKENKPTIPYLSFTCSLWVVIFLFFYLYSGVEFDPYYDHHYTQVEARVAGGNLKSYTKIKANNFGCKEVQNRTKIDKLYLKRKWNPVVLIGFRNLTRLKFITLYISNILWSFLSWERVIPWSYAWTAQSYNFFYLNSCFFDPF
jgi:hypothetical protein